MAIVQVSQITARSGLQTDLPQLAGGEFGWSNDTRQLYIGNGTLVEGAPVVGNTEILTEFSDILNLAASYTYKGTAAGYIVQTGPTPGNPVVQSLQSWMDQFASVKDFGAKGDGLTDDTAAINRALNQLYCQNGSISSRRSLFFPAGIYKVSSTINVPAYATLYGEGPLNSIIQLTATSSAQYVVQTADSQQQTGAQSGANGATLPTDINISGMAFESLNQASSIMSLYAANNCQFHSVSFIGANTDIIDNTDFAANPLTACVYVAASSSTVAASNVIFDGCSFIGETYGYWVNDFETDGVTITDSKFYALKQGVVLQQGSSNGPTGTRIVNNTFDKIYNEGIIFSSPLNASGYNIFYDVGDSFQGPSNPTTAIIELNVDNNVSIGDMFARPNSVTYIQPTIYTAGSRSIATDGGTALLLGSATIDAGVIQQITSNVSNATLFTFNTATEVANSFLFDYTIVRTIGNVQQSRSGSFTATTSGNSNVIYSDDYLESTGLGITMSAIMQSTVVTVQYSSTPGTNGSISYVLTYQN